MNQPPLKAVIEAILFASDEPVSDDRLAATAGEDVTVGAVREAAAQLQRDYEATGRAFTVQEIAGGFQLFTRPEFNKYLKQLLRARQEARFTQAALETLSIVAYKQPIARAEIEDIRGVASSDILRTLMEKGFVRIAGRGEGLGRPLLYGTTKKFLMAFGLSSIKDLPPSNQLLQP
ncbi:MAG: SMC-Scp complex subunit ScpB [Planctomycetes bacterium]|nr:SMC-Scp complex subunit ScpB [Planctomycetota bacterium]